ncbi:hypothetical protein BJY52DRAFT_1419797 [Lactarius psammicola]|nr:hypothetical protein BJY52DRAFT_1419797 [Lactarius psammicola]
MAMAGATWRSGGRASSTLDVRVETQGGAFAPASASGHGLGRVLDVAVGIRMCGRVCLGGHDPGEGREGWVDKERRPRATVATVVCIAHVKEIKKVGREAKGRKTMVEEREFKEKGTIAKKGPMRDSESRRVLVLASNTRRQTGRQIDGWAPSCYAVFSGELNCLSPGLRDVHVAGPDERMFPWPFDKLVLASHLRMGSQMTFEPRVMLQGWREASRGPARTSEWLPHATFGYRGVGTRDWLRRKQLEMSPPRGLPNLVLS